MAKNLPPVIGLTGRKRAGKDTTADLLLKELSMQRTPIMRMAFADPIRAGLEAMFGSLGLNMRPDLDRESPVLLGRSRRYLMQTLGTEWGRDLVHPDIWIEVAKARLAGAAREGFTVVITDVRMPNEAELIRELGGEVWRVENDRLPPPTDQHVSEIPLHDRLVARTVHNNDTLDELRVEVKRAMLESMR